MEYSEPIYEFHNAKLVSVIASFNTDGKVKPLYVRMNEEPVKVLSSKVIQTTLHMIAFEVIVDDYGRQRIIRLLYKINESIWYANIRTQDLISVLGNATSNNKKKETSICQSQFA